MSPLPAVNSYDNKKKKRKKFNLRCSPFIHLPTVLKKERVDCEIRRQQYTNFMQQFESEQNSSISKD